MISIELSRIDHLFADKTAIVGACEKWLSINVTIFPSLLYIGSSLELFKNCS